MNDAPVRPDYRGLRLRNVTDPAYRHILLLLYWPIHGLLFLLLERGGLRMGTTLSMMNLLWQSGMAA